MTEGREKPARGLEKTGSVEWKFDIGDHVKTEAQDLTYLGYVKERRPYKQGGNEYNVDFYSYAQGLTWVVEWRLEKVPKLSL